MEIQNDAQRSLTRRELAALRRLRTLGSLECWRPDILMKIILDIDSLFFNGRLRNNIAVRWCIEPHKLAVAYCHAPISPYKRPWVGLNVPHIIAPDRTANDCLMVMMHELCHAILRVFCDSVTEQGVATVDRSPFNPDRGHGVSFELVMGSVQARLGQTRYCRMTKKAGDKGGTVPRDTPLYAYWVCAGGYRASHERERQSEKALRAKSRGQASELQGKPSTSAGWGPLGAFRRHRTQLRWRNFPWKRTYSHSGPKISGNGFWRYYGSSHS